MFGKYVRFVAKIVAKYPSDPCVRPDCFKSTKKLSCSSISGRLSIQSVHDRFYFLLFGAIRGRLAHLIKLNSELVAVRSINGAVGAGWKAFLMRSAPFNLLMNLPWERAYSGQIDRVAYRSASWVHPISDLLDWFRSKIHWHNLREQNNQFSLIINGVEIADLVVDSYLRFKPSPEFNVNDPFVRKLVWQALRDLRQANQYFGHNSRPDWYLTSYTTYLEHGIAARVALKHGISVWSFGSLSRFTKKLSGFDSYQTPDFSDYRSTFDLLDEKKSKLELARQHLDNRLSGGIDSATCYMKKSAYDFSAIELPDGLDGAAVIFLHDFYDSPHVYPDLIFDDFWSWVCFTIEKLDKANIRFFIKPHPNQVALSDVAVERLSRKYPNLNWLSTKVNNLQLAHGGIACGITAYGTVAHELAYLGVPSICCARHPHHTFDFCRTARTTEEYSNYLVEYDFLPAPRDVMKNQALTFYYMHNLHGDSNELELRKAFVSLWSVCNNDKSTKEEVMASLNALTKLDAFDQFINEMLLDVKLFPSRDYC